jgi:hypothetical protein
MMLINQIILSILSLFLSIQVLYAQINNRSEQRVAVLNLLNQAQLKVEEIDFLTNLIRQSFAEKAGTRFLIMTQENITLLLPPDKKIEDCLQECEVETGRVLGAKYILTGAVLIFSGTYRLNLKIHDTETGSLVTSQVLKGKNLEELEASIQQAIATLFTKLMEVQSDRNTLVGVHLVQRLDQNQQKELAKAILAAEHAKQASSKTQKDINRTQENLDQQKNEDLALKQKAQEEKEYQQALGAGVFVGTGIGIEYGLFGGQLGFQYQAKAYRIKTAIAISPLTTAYSLKLFLSGPQRHQFGVGISTLVLLDERLIDGSLLYVFDFGALGGFQCHLGLGAVSSIDKLNDEVDYIVFGSGGIHYIF